MNLTVNNVIFILMGVSFLCYLLSFKFKNNKIINSIKMEPVFYIIVAGFLIVNYFFPTHAILFLFVALFVYSLYNLFKEKEDKLNAQLTVIFFFCLMVTRVFFLDFLTTPTGSMLPTVPIEKVYVLDRSAYGINIPFVETNKNSPKRGDIITFNHEVKCEENCWFGDIKTTPYLKRALAIEGDTLIYNWKYKTFKIIDENGKEYNFLKKPSQYQSGNKEEDKNYNYFIETVVNDKGEVLFEHLIREHKKTVQEVELNKTVLVSGEVIPIEMVVKIPKGYFMAIGDNRDESYDSRYFGYVANSKLLGKTWYQYGMPEVK